MILLLDTNILIDVIRGRSLAPFRQAVDAGHLLATSAVSVGEIYAGTRPTKEQRTAALLSGLACYPATAAIGERAGKLVNSWARRGRTLELDDMLIAATAIENGLALMTSNRQDFPMAELTFYPLG